MTDYDWDVFISHASEDKEAVARPLTKALTERGLHVWFDAHTLRVGDSLRRKIDEGLSRSRYGIVILSPAFFSKQWSQWELDGLASREVDGDKVILPVWHHVTAAEVRSFSPMLAGRLGTLTANGIDAVVKDIFDAVGDKTQEAITRHAREGRPTSGAVEVRRRLAIRAMIDTGHNLHKWDRGHLPRLRSHFHVLREVAIEAGYRIQEKDLGDFSSDRTRGVDLIVLVNPRDRYYSKIEIDHLVQYCEGGGNLVVLGYYWWESDHDSNTGALTRHFGINLRDDRVSDSDHHADHEYVPKCRCLLPSLTDKPVAMPYTCSMECTHIAEPLLITSDRSASESVVREDRQIVRRYDTKPIGQLITAARGTLDGGGRVAVFGSWEVLLNAYLARKEFGNREVLKGTLQWLRSAR